MSPSHVPEPRPAPPAGRPPGIHLVRAAGARPAAGCAPRRVLIAHHQPIVRHGVRDLLGDEPGLAVVAEAESGAEAERLARQLRPDVVLVDLLLPPPGGLAVTRAVCAALPGARVIVMSGVDEDAVAVEAFRAGAVAYLPKEVPVEVLLRAVRGAGTGQVELPAGVAARLLGLVGRRDALSARETEVLRLVAHGLANKQIAAALGISMSTVKAHVGHLLAKLSLPSRTRLALYAAQTGLTVLERPDLGMASGHAMSAS